MLPTDRGHVGSGPTGETWAQMFSVIFGNLCPTYGVKLLPTNETSRMLIIPSPFGGGCHFPGRSGSVVVTEQMPPAAALYAAPRSAQQKIYGSRIRERLETVNLSRENHHPPLRNSVEGGQDSLPTTAYRPTEGHQAPGNHRRSFPGFFGVLRVRRKARSAS